jgi:hypothetical protein
MNTNISHLPTTPSQTPTSRQWCSIHHRLRRHISVSWILPLLQLGGSGNLILFLYGRAGANYIVETTKNLVTSAHWLPLTHFALTNSFRFLDAGQPTNRAQFYRTLRP